MSTAFVILAAGKGTRIGRVGETLHKALVPLGGKAVMSHLLALAPAHARVIVCVGHRGDQIKEYIDLAHPQLAVEYVTVEGYDQPGAGPGASLLAAKEAVGDNDMIFTSCDTLWTRDETLWDRSNGSWSAIAPIPAGTPYARWCRMKYHFSPTGTRVEIKDKEPGNGEGWAAYTGLSQILKNDLPDFWAGVQMGDERAGERQVSGGLYALQNRLTLQRIHWTDIGDEEAYHSAVARWEGYDWTKPDEATYVLPEEGRVVKFWADRNILERRRARAKSLEPAVPALLMSGREMLAYEFVAGTTCYQVADRWGAQVTKLLLDWATANLWQPVDLGEFNHATTVALAFYRDKTMGRVMRLDAPLRDKALDALQRVNWNLLAAGCQPGRIHGDFNMGNVIVQAARDGELPRFIGIDWREDFAGEMEWGDMRYDLAKLLAGTQVHWDRAKTGDLRPWADGDVHATVIRNHPTYTVDVEVIGALSLLNSAPLHAAPLDEVLVARGTDWLLEWL